MFALLSKENGIMALSINAGILVYCAVRCQEDAVARRNCVLGVAKLSILVRSKSSENLTSLTPLLLHPGVGNFIHSFTGPGGFGDGADILKAGQPGQLPSKSPHEVRIPAKNPGENPQKISKSDGAIPAKSGPGHSLISATSFYLRQRKS